MSELFDRDFFSFVAGFILIVAISIAGFSFLVDLYHTGSIVLFGAGPL